MTSSFAEEFLNIQDEFSKKLNSFLDNKFGGTVDHVIHPHDHAYEPYRNFVEKYLDQPKSVLLLGMNAGPNGMAKYGVPFGDISLVVKWLGITGEVSRRVSETDNDVKYVSLQNCVKEKREESGKRLWKLISELNESPEKFFSSCFVHNYCPLAFSRVTSKGKRLNVAPQNIKRKFIAPLEKVCDTYLEKTIQYLKCRFIVAVGRYAEKRAKNVVKKQTSSKVTVMYIPHPSPLTRMNETKWRQSVKQEIEKHKNRSDVIPLIAHSQDAWEKLS